MQAQVRSKHLAQPYLVQTPGLQGIYQPSPWDLLIPDLCAFGPDIPSICVQYIAFMHPWQSPFSNFSSETLAFSKPSSNDSSVQPLACCLCSVWTCRNIAQQLHTVSYLCALADCPSTMAHNSLLLENFYSAFKTYFKWSIWEVTHFWYIPSPDWDTHSHIHAASTGPVKTLQNFTHLSPL